MLKLQTLETKKIPDIQVLRGIAIALVLVCHFSFSTTILKSISTTLSNPFYIGVDLFFVISGYVVTYSVFNGSHSPVVFALKRLFRLYPALLAGLCFSAFTMVFAQRLAPDAWSRHFFSTSWNQFMKESLAISGGYFNTFSNVSYQNGAMWSLSVEFQFYACVFVILLIAQFFKANIGTLRRAFVVLASTLFLLAIYGRCGKIFGYGAHAANFMLRWHFDFMLLGVLLALFQERLTSFFDRISQTLAPFLIGLPLLFLAFCRSSLSPQPSSTDNRDGYGFILTQLCFVLLVGLAARSKLTLRQGRVYSLLHLLGERSYTVYIVHFACMSLAWFALCFIDFRLVSQEWIYAFAQPLATIVIMAPFTQFIYRYIEVPMNKRGHALASQPSTEKGSTEAYTSVSSREDQVSTGQTDR